MSLASKFNLLIAALAIVASLLLTLFVGQRDFSYQRDAIALKASSLVGSQPHLQLTFYYRDEVQTHSTASEFLALSPAIRRVSLYDNQGEVIARETQPWAAADESPRLADLRNELPPLEQAMVTRKGGSLPASLSNLAFITGGEHTTSLTIPVIAAIDPSVRGQSREDFAAALADPDLVKSSHVIGYVEVGLSNTMIWSLTMPTIILSAGIGVLIVFTFWFIARLLTRRITRPLTNLARVADDIAAGKQTATIPVSGSGEIRDIAQVLNGVITGMHKSAVRMDTDRKILNLKVDQRDQELTEKQEKLTEAAKQVSDTRDKMRYLAYFDTLTALPNRKLFLEQLTLLLRLAGRTKHRVGLLCVDIDNFKRVNDSFGATTGDRILKIMSERLTEAVRESDVLHRHSAKDYAVMDLSRMAGDEFSVVLNNVESIDAAKEVAWRLANAVAAPVNVDERDLVITCSIGIAIAPDHAPDTDSLLRAADAAMLSAKEDGRNRIAVFETNMETANRERLQLETDLRTAIEGGQLMLHYQPQVNARTGEIYGAESLVRWVHPERGLIPPNQWIPVAEDLGLIGDVGQWVLNEACADLLRFRAAGLSLPKISVNISALQLTDDFVHAVSAALAFTGLPASSLALELTESVMVSDQEKTLGLVNRLKEMGMRLSIDDFGTGYSSLAYLSRLPLDELKIDRSFVMGLEQGETNAELVSAIIAMAKSLELDVVIEGVERIEEVEFFRELDVHVIQGFIFSEPVPAGEFKKQLVPRYYAEKLGRLYAAAAAGPLASVKT